MFLHTPYERRESYTFCVGAITASAEDVYKRQELIRNKSKKSILMIEKGKPVEKRNCPKSVTNKCVNCKPCNITTGFSGAGAFSDGKLSLSYEVGGDLPDLIGASFAQELINYADSIYIEFGADKHIEGLGHSAEVKDIRKRAIQAGLKPVSYTHLDVYKRQGMLFAHRMFFLQNYKQVEYQVSYGHCFCLFSYLCLNP